ncbi:MAG: DivIVA domain-containing protein [Thermoleophilia bacterium]|nr:DivIVA domain-containing protein [Thermoleophilia bacterium]
MTLGNIFGSGELTPDLVRGVSFTDHDGRYDAAEVDAYLDRLASAVGVLLSGDAPTALRAEFARNAEIAQQVLDAGHAAAEQLRRQAEEDTRALLARAQQQAELDAAALRDGVAADIARSRAQVVEIRDQFIQELRDLYDRIGASLYRFEKANAEEQSAPIQPPPPAAGWGYSDGAEDVIRPTGEFQTPDTETADAPRAGGSWLDTPADAVTIATPADPEGADAAADTRPPAWTQLPAEAWTADPPAAAPASNIELGDPFEVVEDEPLAPGEPLIDLRNFGELEPSWEIDADHAAPLAPDVDVTHAPLAHGESVFSDHVELEQEPAVVIPPVADPIPNRIGSGWLEGTTDPTSENVRAEALLAGTAGIDPTGSAPPAPETPGPISGQASPDALAVRRLILDSLAAGQSRQAIEQYLETQLGLVSPGSLIDAALAGG